MKIKKCIGLLLAAVLTGGMLSGCGNSNTVSIVNVSYDPTRELYTEYNTIFAEHWKEQTGQDVEVIQSHGGQAGAGSGKWSGGRCGDTGAGI